MESLQDLAEPNPLFDMISVSPSHPRLSSFINENKFISHCEDLDLEDGESTILGWDEQIKSSKGSSSQIFQLQGIIHSKVERLYIEKLDNLRKEVEIANIHILWQYEEMKNSQQKRWSQCFFLRSETIIATFVILMGIILSFISNWSFAPLTLQWGVSWVQCILRVAMLVRLIGLICRRIRSNHATQHKIQKPNLSIVVPDFSAKKLSELIPENPTQFIDFLLSNRPSASFHQILIWEALISLNWVKQFQLGTLTTLRNLLINEELAILRQQNDRFLMKWNKQ